MFLLQNRARRFNQEAGELAAGCSSAQPSFVVPDGVPGELYCVCYRLDLPVGMDIMVSEEGPRAQWLENRDSRVGRFCLPLTCVGGISVSEVSSPAGSLTAPSGDLGGLLCSALFLSLSHKSSSEVGPDFSLSLRGGARPMHGGRTLELEDKQL